MFREMRRKKQLLSADRTEKILIDGKTGILGVAGDDGYPYTVPVNYVYKDDNIFFHCAKADHKLDAMKSHDKVSFCVIEKEDIIPEELTAYFRSAIAFGRADEVTDDDEKWEAMRLLNEKYAPGLREAGDKEIEGQWNALCVMKIRLEHVTGKESIELVNA